MQSFWIDRTDNLNDDLIMSCGMPHASMGPQAFVDQRPVYDGARRKRRRKGYRENQVIGRGGIIRPDKRQRSKYY
jgi:hypothetical protein